MYNISYILQHCSVCAAGSWAPPAAACRPVTAARGRNPTAQTPPPNTTQAPRSGATRDLSCVVRGHEFVFWVVSCLLLVRGPHLRPLAAQLRPPEAGIGPSRTPPLPPKGQPGEHERGHHGAELRQRPGARPVGRLVSAAGTWAPSPAASPPVVARGPPIQIPPHTTTGLSSYM